jgi:hypothetical protein
VPASLGDDRERGRVCSVGVHILKGETEGEIVGALGGHDGIESLEKDGALVPLHVVRSLDEVVTVPSRDGDEWDGLTLVADLGQELGDLVLDLVEARLGVVDRLLVHLVHTDDHLLHTEGEGEESVLPQLTLLGVGGLELTGGSGHHEDGAVGLGGAGDHVLDEVTVSGSIDDGEVELLGLELPQSDVDGDTTLTLGLQFVEHPCVLERTLTHLCGLLLELLDGTLVDTSALVDQVTGGGGLTRVHMTNHHQVDVHLILTHDD